MSEYGFDPSIILSGRLGPDPSMNETLQTLSNLQSARLKQQEQQQNLADLARQRSQQSQLENIYKSNAGTPDNLAGALMQGGFGPQAFAAQDQASQMATAAATRQKLLRELQDAHRKHMGDLFFGVKDDADYQSRLEALKTNPDPMLSIYADHMPAKFDSTTAPGIQRIGNWSLTAKEQADLAEKEKDRQNRTDNARIMAKSRLAVANTGGAAGLSDDSVDAEAQAYNETHQLPSGLGPGKAGAAARTRIMNRAAELRNGAPADLAGAGASFKADSKSLAKQQVAADAMNAFEGTALKNLDTFLDQAKQVVGVGSPLFNAPARKFAESVAGDPKMAAFSAARQTAVQEIGKVLSGSQGSAAISDSARHEVEGLLKPDASLAQLTEAARILKKDMANRRAAVEEQLKATRSRMSGKPAGEAAKPTGKLSQSEADEMAQLRKELGL